MERVSAVWAKFRQQPPWLQVVVGAVVVGLLATLVMGGVGGDSDAQTTTETTSAAQRDLQRRESPLPPRCLDVPVELAKAIELGLSKVEGGGRLQHVYAVLSKDRAKVHFISADVEGPGLEGDDDVSTWAKSGPLGLGEGLVFSVDDGAREWSIWSDAKDQDAELSMDDDGAEESRDCVEAAAKAAKE